MAITISSPGVEVKEIDLTLRPVIPVGTNVLVLGFAPQGPTDDVLQVSNFGEFETIFGKPTNAAERYFYHSVQAVFNSPANVIVGRLGYGAGLGTGFGNNYTALAYPVVPVSPSLSSTSLSAGYLTAASLSATVQGYVVGKPYQLTLTPAEYTSVVNGNFTWNDVINLNSAITGLATIGNAGIIVLNKAKTTTDDKYQGYYLGISDTSYVNPASDFTSLQSVYSVNANNGTTFVQVPENRINFALSAAHIGQSGSVSEVLENVTGFDVGNTNFADTLLLGVFKLQTSVYAPDTISLNFQLSEGFTGSLDSTRRVQDQHGGSPVTFFLGDVEDGSPNIQILVNPSISRTNGSWTDQTTGLPSRYVQTYKTGGTADTAINWAVDSVLDKVDSLFALGSYAVANSTTLSMGAIPDKVTRLLSLVENVETIPIDVTVEAGLGTIYAASRNSSLSASGSFDDTIALNLSGAAGGFYKLSQGLTDTLSRNIQADYETVQNAFINFAETVRKDHLYISDPLRHIFVQGADGRVLDDITKTFSIYTYWPLKHLYENLNTSYATTYGNWARVYDGATDAQFWCPFSGMAASNFAAVDSVAQKWTPAAGFINGRVRNITDLAVSPSQKQRDMLYKIGINPVTQFPNEGFVIFGQKTLLKVPSAFDRINVRRLFLFLEVATRETLKFFVFQPNTIVTRNRVVNNLTPIMEVAKATEGLYDYLIICDERNNTADIIDQNELVVDVYIKPVRAAEFILVNFYATRTGQNFAEITG